MPQIITDNWKKCFPNFSEAECGHAELGADQGDDFIHVSLLE